LKLVKQTYLLVAILFSIGTSYGESVRNFLYDMGTTSSRVESGYHRVSPQTNYTAKRGYGWLQSPQSAFDTLYSRIPDTLLCDGVKGTSEIRFKADIPAGDYFVLLTVGHPGQEVSTVRIELNDQVVAENIAAPWFRLPYRSVRKKVHIGTKGAIVKIKAIDENLVGVYRIEFRPVVAFPELILSQTPETTLEEMQKLVKTFQEKQQISSGNISLINRLAISQKLLTAATYYEMGGWEWAVRQTKMNQIQRMYASIDLLEQLIADPSDPLYYKSLYLLAKMEYWLVKEDRGLLPDSKAQAYFEELSNVFPDHPIIKMYRGEQLEDPFVAKSDFSKAPDWAQLQHEAMTRMLKVIHWWVDHRQAANGELGGKYGDDVEILRWWLPAILGADDDRAREGYTRLANGIWNSGALVNGYDKKIDDVEHAAELFRDSHTGMFLVRYGDPAFVERAMISMQNFEKVWSGITKSGHRHFKSYFFSATETRPEMPYGVDVPLNARALLPGLWAAWYNRNSELTRLFLEWAKAWTADAERTDNGKPMGIIPPAVAFGEEKIARDSATWYAPKLRYSYYDWDHLGHISELYSFLSGLHAVTGEAFLLNPINKVAELMAGDPVKEVTEPGTLAWVKNTLISGGEDKTAGANPFGAIFAMTAKLTGDSRYDNLVKRYASPYNKYQFIGDKKELLAGFDNILQSLRYNFPLLTNEVKFTDRVYVKGSDLLTGMYTGHFGRGFEFPALVATWKNTGKDVAVFVRNGDTSSALISLYNAGNQKQVEMNTWLLKPGVYRLTVGLDRNDDMIAEEIIQEQLITIKERVQKIQLKLPARQQVVVRMTQVSEGKVVSTTLPDIALSEEDISLSKIAVEESIVRIDCTVHNIGNAASESAMAYLSINGAITDSVAVASIQAPNDLYPKTKTVHFNWLPTAGKQEITVSVKSQSEEWNSYNNSATIHYTPTAIKQQ
jgi:hypothetical protein